MKTRKIIHMDMDAFYASVEQKDNPDLRGKPIAVGGNRERGVVAAASYEARKFGVKSAMPSKMAIKRCPELIFVRPRFPRYKEISRQIMDIFYEYTDLVEPLSIDEAFLDVTENKMDNPSASLIAKEIRKKILEKTGLTASAGISYNKFLAKTASDVNKPNGMFLIKPVEGETYVEKLPVERFFGIGKATAERMHKMGLFFGKDLKQCSEEFLIKNFGKSGLFYYHICRGVDNRPVKPNRIRKSVGIENTYEKDKTNREQVWKELDKLTEGLVERLEKSQFKGKTLTLKLKYFDFEQHTRSKTIHKAILEKDLIESLWKELYSDDLLVKPIRLLGLSVSNIVIDEKREAIQLHLDF